MGDKIHDNRFLRLLKGLLQAGYLENWKYHATLSGTPQGGVVSPILANIYLDRFDQYIQQTLIPAYTRGERRAENGIYTALKHKAARRERAGRRKEAHDLRKQIRQLPSKDTNDPNYRRLRYCRYADDFLLGFTGPRQEAEEIKCVIGEWLQDNLKLTLSEEKTLITHATTDRARFLGYELATQQGDDQRTAGRRSVNCFCQSKTRPFDNRK